MKKFIASSIAALAVVLTACTTTAVSGSFCSTDGDCPDGQLCVNGECFDSRGGSGATPCTDDGDCGSGQSCASTGFCEAEGNGSTCTVTADCPIDQYCNITIETPICTVLLSGACREASQCAGLQCTATAGGVGRCVECLRSVDCASNVCNADGTCAPGGGATDAGVLDMGGGYDSSVPDSGGGCSPACNTAAGETCVSGVCYGANGCPLHAHPEGAGCVCDTGYVPNSTGTACVTSSSTDAGTAYDAGSSVDAGGCIPACTVDETCYQGVCYGADGCPTFSHPDDSGQYCVCDDGYVPNAAGTGCELATAGSCPPNSHPANGGCACDDGYQPNAAGTACEPIGGGTDAGVPDSGGSGDFCLDYGLYGNGTCDDYCPSPDPDCGSGGGGSCPPNSYLESDGYCYCNPGYEPDPSGTSCVPESGGGGSDPCADYGYYGDGECDTFCAEPDPDCGGGSGDFCEDYGWYGDGICDTQCPQPDPDCGGASGDYCADWGWYNDGYCDDCPSPDPDCSSGGGGGGYNYCESDWDCWEGYYCDWYSSTCEPY